MTDPRNSLTCYMSNFNILATILCSFVAGFSNVEDPNMMSQHRSNALNLLTYVFPNILAELIVCPFLVLVHSLHAGKFVMALSSADFFLTFSEK